MTLVKAICAASPALPRSRVRRCATSARTFFAFHYGPVVLQAARYPFRRVIGVELSPVLHAHAQRNVELALATLRCKDVALVNRDVLAYEVPDDVTVVYFYNPFQGSVFSSIVGKLLL